MGSDDNRFLTAKLQMKRRAASRRSGNTGKIFALITLAWARSRTQPSFTSKFVVTAAALSARVKIQVASLGMCRWLKGIPECEESTQAAGCLLAGCGGLLLYSQLCDTAGSQQFLLILGC